MADLGEMEQRVMDVVWDQPGLSVREVADAMRGPTPP